MSFMDTLKGMVYETPTENTAQKPAAVVSAVGAGGAQSSQAAGVNGAMVDAIKKVTFGRNTAFTQLLQAAETLNDVIPDQTMRLKAAYKMAGAGRTAAQIADAVSVHLQDVDGEEIRFKTVLTQKIGGEIAALKAKTSTSTTRIQQAQAELQTIQERTIALNTLIQQLSTEIAADEVQVQQKTAEQSASEAEFKIAADVVRAELNTNKSAIVSTLV